MFKGTFKKYPSIIIKNYIKKSITSIKRQVIVREGTTIKTSIERLNNVLSTQIDMLDSLVNSESLYPTNEDIEIIEKLYKKFQGSTYVWRIYTAIKAKNPISRIIELIENEFISHKDVLKDVLGKEINEDDTEKIDASLKEITRIENEVVNPLNNLKSSMEVRLNQVIENHLGNFAFAPVVEEITTSESESSDTTEIGTERETTSGKDTTSGNESLGDNSPL